MPQGTTVEVKWTFSKPENYGIFSWLLTYDQAGITTGQVEYFDNTQIKAFFVCSLPKTVTFKCRIHWIIDGTFVTI